MQSFSRSLRHAFRGVVYAFRHERNFRIECAVGLIVAVLSCVLPISGIERSIIFFLMGWVLAFELINTSIERMLDIIKPNVHPYVRIVKDMSAGAVLVSSVVAVIIGIVLFSPYFL